MDCEVYIKICVLFISIWTETLTVQQLHQICSDEISIYYYYSFFKINLYLEILGFYPFRPWAFKDNRNVRFNWLSYQLVENYKFYIGCVVVGQSWIFKQIVLELTMDGWVSVQIDLNRRGVLVGWFELALLFANSFLNCWFGVFPNRRQPNLFSSSLSFCLSTWFFNLLYSSIFLHNVGWTKAESGYRLMNL